MIKSEKRLKDLDLILKSNNSLRISEAIELLRNVQPFEGVIGLLVSYYGISNNASIKKLISNFMNDLKDQTACKEVMAAIRGEKLPETRRMLISSCWQSGLDYSGFSTDFAEFFIFTDDYMTAVECFSVLESSAPKITRAKKDEIIKMIKRDNSYRADSRSKLGAELVSLLSL